MTRTSVPFSIGATASVSSDAAKNGYLISNYPNPASDHTTINVTLPIASTVTVHIIDGLGKEVAMIASKRYEAGSYSLPVNTSALAGGLYSYILQTGTTTLTGKMSIVK